MPHDPELQVPKPPSMAAFLSGKTPKLDPQVFVAKAREKLSDLTPPPGLSVTVTQKGEDPLLDLRLTRLRAFQLTQAFGLLAAAALESWTESLQ